MGSFSSKMRQSTPENTGNSTKMSEPEASPGEAKASERTTGRTDVTNGEKAKIGNIHQEKPKVVQSFGWLVETPVILHTTAKEIKDRGKNLQRIQKVNRSASQPTAMEISENGRVGVAHKFRRYKTKKAAFTGR